MRKQKVRGHRRIWRDIEKWKLANLELDIENLKNHERDYAKMYVSPYSSISFKNSYIPQPKGETKRRLFLSLIEIYDHWRNEVNKLNEPYYLKIWFFDPRFSKSQVVCAIRDSINFYQNTFNPNSTPKSKLPSINKSLNEIINGFKWLNMLDEEFRYSTDIGDLEDYESEDEYLEEVRFFKKQLKRKHHTSELKDGTICYSFVIGDVWIGEK